MSFRAFWIISKDSKGQGHLLLSRKYPTVERRWHLINNIATVNDLPDDDSIIECVFEKLQIGRSTLQFVEKFDGCKDSKKEPVMKLNVDSKELWPLIVLQKSELILMCLCLAGKKEISEDTSLVKIPAISIGYSLLQNIMEFLELVPFHSKDEFSSHIQDLAMVLQILMPFGTPSDVNLNLMKSFLLEKGIKCSQKYRLSGWRPLASAKTKNLIQLNVKEQYKAMIYNDKKRAMYRDQCSVDGSVSCKADVDAVPEINMTLTHLSNIHMAFHPCLQSLEVASNAKEDSVGKVVNFYNMPDTEIISRNVHFTPPPDSFPLVNIYGDCVPPVSGCYEIRSESEVKCIRIKLKLHKQMKNLFEYFEVHVPFFDCGLIHKWDFDYTVGTVLVSPDKKRLIWSVGQKFPKTLEIDLHGRVLLSSPASPESSSDTFEGDPFCSGPITYIQLLFKSTNNTFSGIDIDRKSVRLNPSGSPKVTVVKDLVSCDYKIWNTYGDARIAFPPTL